MRVASIDYFSLYLFGRWLQEQANLPVHPFRPAPAPGAKRPKRAIPIGLNGYFSFISRTWTPRYLPQDGQTWWGSTASPQSGHVTNWN